MLRNQPEFVYAFAAHSQLEIEVAWNTCSTAWATSPRSTTTWSNLRGCGWTGCPPPFLGLPSIHDADGYWDPFFQACEETGTVICMHIGSSSKMPSTSADAPPAVGSTLTFANAAYSLVDWLMSGVFTRFPNLTIAYSEGQIGWMPYVLERATTRTRTAPGLAPGRSPRSR